MASSYRTPHECEEIFATIDPEKVRAASAHLRSWLPAPDRQHLRKIISEHGHYGWIFHLHDEEVAAEPSHRSKAVIAARGHFQFATVVRNELRCSGFGEKELGVQNLDDVYLFIVEEAMKSER
jgi:hypothetical protein